MLLTPSQISAYKLVLSTRSKLPLAVAIGHAAAGLPYFQAAIQANPNQSQFWLSCIDALIQASQLDIARQMLDLGTRSGLSGDAVEALRNRLQSQPSPSLSAESVPSLSAASETGPTVGLEPIPVDGQGAEKQKSSKAVKNRQKKSACKPSAPNPAEIARLLFFFKSGRDQEMETLARSFISRFPKSGHAWNILGALRQRKDRFSDAESCYRSALQADPDCVDACFNLAIALNQQDRFVESEASCRRALELRPEFAEAHNNLAAALNRQGRFAESEASCRRALELKPEFALAYNNLGAALQDQGRFAEAEASTRRALELDPGSAKACSNLGVALQDQGRLAEAASCFRRALAFQPDLQDAHQNLLLCLSHDGEIGPQALFDEHLRFAEHFEAPLRPAWPRHRNSRDPGRQLRIGFVSGDFRKHAMAYFMEPIFSQLVHDAELSLHAYYNNAIGDEVTHRVRGYFSHWNRVFTFSDEMLAAKIQADGIDILVDLTGHTTHSRLLTFARKPAPVQCGWIGYLGTSGLQSIDYYLADLYFLPPGEFDRYFTEKIVYLPAVAPFQPSLDAPDINPLPTLTSGRFTFGSFSRVSKLSRDVIALWSKLLRALPESQMLMGGMPPDGRSQVVSDWFNDGGIAPERLQFHPRCDNKSYLTLHHEVDLCLDPFPFTGATTASHALWMGVPTLTLRGHTVTGRLGPALLYHAGLEDFVAHSPREFVERGVYWARNLESLAQLRAGMRERFLQSPIGQPALIAQGLAASFRQMWQDWCASPSELSR